MSYTLLADEAARWSCEGSGLCYAVVTADGQALDQIHWPECARFDGDEPAELHEVFGTEAAIDLRAGRTVELGAPFD